LFAVDSGKEDKSKKASDSNKPQSVKNILEGMEELWDTDQYATEYDLDNFMGSLKQ